MIIVYRECMRFFLLSMLFSTIILVLSNKPLFSSSMLSVLPHYRSNLQQCPDTSPNAQTLYSAQTAHIEILRHAEAGFEVFVMYVISCFCIINDMYETFQQVEIILDSAFSTSDILYLSLFDL